MNRQNTLAIAPGTKHIGYAVFLETELREWGIKSLPRVSFKEKREVANKFIKDLVGKYQINTVVLKQHHPSRISKNLSQLVTHIKGKTLNEFVKHEYSIGDIKQYFFSNKKANKRRIMEKIVELYPFLYIDLQRENRNRNRYFVQMFEAIALGVIKW